MIVGREEEALGQAGGWQGWVEDLEEVGGQERPSALSHRLGSFGASEEEGGGWRDAQETWDDYFGRGAG